MQLYTKGDYRVWNHILTKCLRKMDMDRLATLRYQLQAGMDDLAKKKLNTDEMCKWFIRLQNSVENTAKKILRKKYPNPCDNPLTIDLASLDAKRKRDHEFELWLKKTGY